MYERLGWNLAELNANEIRFSSQLKRSIDVPKFAIYRLNTGLAPLGLIIVQHDSNTEFSKQFELHAAWSIPKLILQSKQSLSSNPKRA